MILVVMAKIRRIRKIVEFKTRLIEELIFLNADDIIYSKLDDLLIQKLIKEHKTPEIVAKELLNTYDYKE